MKKSLFSVTSLIALVLLVGCGKTNKVETNRNTGIAPNGSFPLSGVPGVTPQQVTSIDQIKMKYPCQTGARIADMIYSTQGSFSGNIAQVSGSFQQGQAPGTAAGVYVGVSSFGDVMVLTKMTNGANVIGFNVVLSMCPFQPLIIQGRPLGNFQAPLGIALIDVNSCATGSLSASRTRLDAAQYQYYPAAIVETTFSPPSCQ